VLKSAKDVFASGGVVGVVDYAIELNRQALALKEQLEEAKDILRVEAKKRQPGGKMFYPNITLEGNVGEVTVSFTCDTYRLRQGVNLLACRKGIPPDLWNSLFVTKTSVEFAPDFFQKVVGLKGPRKTLMDNLVERVPSAPRVNLPR
jgi:hypothetical protein